MTKNMLMFLLFVATTKDQDGGYIITSPQRSLEEIDRIYATMPPVKYTPSLDRWKNLLRTKKLLEQGGGLRIVQLGDSIINDMSRSGWTLLLGRRYPQAKIQAITCVRGSTGCWWYKEESRLKKYVLDQKPDLLVIGGISQRGDMESIRAVVEKTRAHYKTEVLLLTGPFGSTDPQKEGWRFEIDPAGGDERARLKRLADEVQVGFIDLHGLWGSYVRDSGKDLDWFKRDQIHANERGEQILARLLELHFAREEEDNRRVEK